MNRHLIIALAALILALPGLILFSNCSPLSSDHKARAAIIDQLSVLRPNPVFINRITEVLETSGFSVDVHQGDEITVDFYRKLAKCGYKLIIFRVHSGILGIRHGSELKITERTWLFTNETYNMAKYATGQLTKQLGKARINKDYPWVFAIGSKFIDQSMEGKFPNTVIIMMGCSSLRLDDLAQAFIQKDASAYLGWNATVDLSYVDEATVSLMQKLSTEQLTVEKAIIETMAEKGPDPTWGAVLRYYPTKSGAQTISELVK